MIEDLNSLLIDFSKFLRHKGKQPATIASYKTDASGFLNFLLETKVNLQKTEHSTLYSYTEKLASEKGESANSIRRKVIGIKQFYHFLVCKRKISSNPLLANIIPKRDEKLPENLELQDIQIFLSKAQQQKHPLKKNRDPAILALLALEGLKVTEIVELKKSDVLITNKGSSLRIRGYRKRVVELDPKTHVFLTSYLKELRALKLSKDQPNLFVALKGKEQRATFDQISRHGMKFLIYEIGESCGYSKLNTELLRHHAINYLLKRYGYPEAVRQHLGLKQAGNINKHLKKSKKNDGTKQS